MWGLVAVRLGLGYFAAVFAVGFVLGILRVLLLERWIGALPAVMLELPVILAASWLICGWFLRGRDLRTGARAAMGGTAFACLMLAELALAMAFGQTPAEHLQGYASPAQGLGLAGQTVFGLMPLVQGRSGSA